MVDDTTTLENPTQTWHDRNLGAGSLALYRVRAFFGSKASAPSNPAVAVTWIDLDGNGIPAPQPPPPPIVDGGNGPNPVLNPPNDGNGGGGDRGNGTPGDGDGDGDPDDDKDGVVDTHDRYPDDPRRSEDIPVKFFGVIDLNPQPLDPATGDFVAINDKNSVPWGAVRPSTEKDAANIFISYFRSITWENGTPVAEPAVRLTESGGNRIRHWSLNPVGVEREKGSGEYLEKGSWKRGRVEKGSRAEKGSGG